VVGPVEEQASFNRILKKSFVSPARLRRAKTHPFPGVVLASFRPSTLSGSFSEVGSTGGACPFVKTHFKGERPTRSAVCTFSVLHSLRLCLGQGASMGEEAFLADPVGQVRSLDFEYPAKEARWLF
jgi:hypothetical protein